MNGTLFRSLIGLVVVSALLAWSVQRLRRRLGLGEVAQLVGALGFLTVVAAHFCEGLRVFPAMGWGRPNSAGHYVDLSGAVAGLALVPIGYVLSKSHRS